MKVILVHISLFSIKTHMYCECNYNSSFWTTTRQCFHATFKTLYYFVASVFSEDMDTLFIQRECRQDIFAMNHTVILMMRYFLRFRLSHGKLFHHLCHCASIQLCAYCDSVFLFLRNDVVKCNLIPETFLFVVSGGTGFRFNIVYTGSFEAVGASGILFEEDRFEAEFVGRTRGDVDGVFESQGCVVIGEEVAYRCVVPSHDNGPEINTNLNFWPRVYVSKNPTSFKGFGLWLCTFRYFSSF